MNPDIAPPTSRQQRQIQREQRDFERQVQLQNAENELKGAEKKIEEQHPLVPTGIMNNDNGNQV